MRSLSACLTRRFLSEAIRFGRQSRKRYEYEIDLMILGTHGRTGAMKLLLGSVAEEIFRRASVPVLTIGRSVRKGFHGGGQFRRVLFATDFTLEAQTAASYAISMAQENQAKLLLLHVMRDPDLKASKRTPQDSVANVMHQLTSWFPRRQNFAAPSASETPRSEFSKRQWNLKLI
jgi:nucleotide-binding universal stress UspA family protein